jgi:DNA topoisomerase-3
MRVVVAEKPSVGRDLARVLGATRKGEGYLEGDGLRVTWAVGHLAELEEPAHYQAAWRRWSLDALPMLPEAFAIRPRASGKDQLAVLRRVLRDPAVTEVVNACDAGREGELIFRWVLELVGCRKPVRRLWISSLTDEAIRAGWSQLQPGSAYDRLADAARSRAEADWLVGLNATRALTCVARTVGGDDVLSVGRVQTPTLAMIVARDREIEAFVPVTYFTVRATLHSGRPDRPGSWTATWVPSPRPDEPRRAGDARGDEPVDDEAPVAERIADRATAEAIAAAARDQVGRVVWAERKRTVEKPPLLYDLTSLQRRANQRYGLSAPQTLEIAQALYERHKLITYPRTDARHLTPDQVPGLPAIVRGLQPVPPYAAVATAVLAAPIQPGRRVVDGAEVGDHHAILPTGKTPDPARLSPDEKRIFDLVARRFLAALSDDALFDVTQLVVAVPPGAPLPSDVATPLHFRARGRVCRQPGWRAIDPPGASRDLELPAVDVGDPADARDPEVLEGQTRPPRPYSDATLLRAMETAGRRVDSEELQRQMRACGLGTPATRAAILEVLVERRYVVRRGRDLVATPRGRSVVDAVTVDELKSAELTGRWEGRLTDVAEGRGDRAQFMADVRAHLVGVVQAIAAAPPPPVEAAQGAVVAPCPGCGAAVRQRSRGYACEAGCGVTVPGQIARRALSERMVRQLLTAGSCPPVKGFQSKSGKAFSAGLRWDAAEKKVVFVFDGPPPGRPDPAPAASPAPAAPAARPAPASPRRAPRRATAATAPSPAAPSSSPAVLPAAPPSPPWIAGAPCPRCGTGRLIQGRTTLGCGRWREGCDFRVG